MPEFNEKTRFFDFGPYRLDRVSRVLFRDGILVPLTPKVLATLAALVERPGEVVSKEHLLQTVWPDSFVEEGNLAQNVSVLRKTFGASNYVETVPKRGYRFIGPVATVSNAEKPVSEPVSEPVSASAPVGPKGRRRPWALAAAILVVAAGGVLYRQSFFVPSIRSLAVLPLANLSSDAAQDYFADGITELLTEQLSKRLPIRVISRTSAARFRNSGKTARTIGAELGVDA